MASKFGKGLGDVKFTVGYEQILSEHTGLTQGSDSHQIVTRSM